VLANSGLAAVYRDEAIVTRRDETSQVPLSSSSQPAIMALMLEMLDVQHGHRVVEIGAGTGYNAGLLAVLCGPSGLVLSCDIDPDTASAAASALRAIGSPALVLVADGIRGLPGLARDRRHRADRWIVTASTTAVPRAWYDQLAHGGRIVLPLRLSDEPDQLHAVTALVKVDDGFDSAAVTPGGFMPLRRTDGTAFDPTKPPTAAAVVAAQSKAEAEAEAEVESEPETVRTEEPTPSTDGGSGGRRIRRGLGVGRRPSSLRPPGALRGAHRDELEQVRIVVRYTGGPPATQWTFDRGDHWIGLDLPR
jgi:protein-L-isoaspartate O-methyltransferase